MKFRDQYDWVVMGDHPGALLSACLSARLGLSVLVLPMNPSARLMIADNGQHFEPEVNFLVGLGKLGTTNGLLAECLNRVGITPVEAELISNEEVFPQVLTPKTRFFVAANDDDLMTEFEREFGKELPMKTGIMDALRQSENEFNQYWLDLPTRLTLSHGKGQTKPIAPIALDTLRSRLMRNSNLSDRLRRMWFSSSKRLSTLAHEVGRTDLTETGAGLWYGATSAVCSDPVLPELLHILALTRTGGVFRGGLSGYRDLLIRFARRLGAHFPESTECRRLFIDGGRFVGVQVSNHGNMIGAQGGAIGCSLQHMGDRMTSSGRSWSRYLKQSPTPVGWKFTVALTVHAEALPSGMSSHLIWQEPGAPVLEIEVANPVEYGLKDSSTRILYMRTVMPFTVESLSFEYQRLIATRMLRQLTELLPYLEFHVVRIYPDFRHDEKRDLSVEHQPQESHGSQGELCKLYNFQTLDAIPGNLRCYSGKGVGSRSGIEGLFVASDESFPELGSLGGTVAAIESVAWLAHKSGLPGPFV